MSYEHVHHILTTSQAKGASRLILVVLAEAADKNGVCWLAVSTIAARANISEIHARNILHQLGADGHISTETRPGTSNRYRLKNVATNPTQTDPTPLTQLDPTPLTQLEVQPSYTPLTQLYPPPLTQLDPPPLTQLEGNHQLKVNEPPLLTGGDSVHTLYMDNFGPITPMLIEELTDLEADYGKQWLVDAMRLAVKSGVRNLRYVSGILRRWKSTGRKEKPAAPEVKPSVVVSKLKEYTP